MEKIFIFLAGLFLLFITITQARWIVFGETETIQMGIAALGFFGSLFMYGYIMEEEN